VGFENEFLFSKQSCALNLECLANKDEWDRACT